MNDEYFYNKGVEDGGTLINGTKSYSEILTTKINDIFEKYGLEKAKAYKNGILSVIMPHQKLKAR